MRMKTYRLIVRDSASDQPFELTAEMASDLRALDFSRQRLAAHPNIVEIDVWSGEGRLCRLQRPGADRSASAVQLGVVAEDALLIERNAAGGR